MAHTTDRAILVLCAIPNLITDVQTITAEVEDDGEIDEEGNDIIEHLEHARELLERFPGEVQQAATKRRIVLPRRLAIMGSVRAAQTKKYGVGGQVEPVSLLLEALADAPSDMLRVIMGFVGEEVEETWEQRDAAAKRMSGLKTEVAGQRRVIEAQRRVIEEQTRENEELRRELSELKGEKSAAGRKRGRKE